MLAQATNVVSTLIPDIAKVVQDIWPNVNLDQGIAIVSGIFILARGLRKAIPDNLQTGTLGTILKHAALEINPAPSTPTPPVAAQPKQP